MKKLTSFLCVLLAIVMVCGIPAASAANVKNKYATKSAAAFAKYMEEQDYIFTYEGAKENEAGKKEDLFSISFNGDNLDEIDLYIWFDYDNKGAELYIWNYAQATAKQQSKLLTLINQMNYDYRYARFYLEDDYSVSISGDAVFRDNDIGEICEEMILHLVNIADDAYPEFEKLLGKSSV